LNAGNGSLNKLETTPPAYFHHIRDGTPAQADMQRFFRVTPPTVHQMLLTLEKAGLISRQPGAARSIAVQVDRADLPALSPGYAQTVKTSVQRY